MRMPSISSNPVRVAPQQERSTRRLAGFLDAAAELFVEVGYEAATMTAVAERSGSSIGALYNYFPDKQSIAFTLVSQYSQEVEAHWKPLMEQAEILTHAEFADRFIERITQFVRERPAYLSLLAAPIRFRRDPCRPKGFTNRNRKRVSGKESLAFEGTVSTCCKRLSPVSPGHDDALRRSRFQRESPDCG